MPAFAPLTPRLVNRRRCRVYDINIGRPGKWGNPFSHEEGTLARFKVNSRDEAVDCFRAYLLGRPDLLADLHELDGKVLGCWCVPKRCHGHVLIEIWYEVRVLKRHGGI